MTRLAFDDVELDLASDGKSYSISLDGHPHRVERLASYDGQFELMIDGRRVRVYVSADGQRRWITVGGRTYLVSKSSTPRHSAAAHDGSSELSAPMPGQVRAVNAKAGERVTKGQVLIVLEAMKMEIRLQAPFDGQVSRVNVTVGETVEREQVLVQLKETPAAQS